jgi:hypothetical protein
MKVILQCRFDPPLKPEKKIVVACGTKWLEHDECCKSFIPGFPERLSFAAYQSVSSD